MRVALALMLLSSCAAERPAFYSVNGVSHFSPERLNWHDATAIEDWTIQNMGLSWGEAERARRCLSFVQAHWRKGEWSVEGGTADGQRDGFDLYVARGQCPWNSAYRHELTHFLSLCLFGDSDHGHSNHPGWWKSIREDVRWCP